MGDWRYLRHLCDLALSYNLGNRIGLPWFRFKSLGFRVHCTENLGLAAPQDGSANPHFNGKGISAYANACLARRSISLGGFSFSSLPQARYHFGILPAWARLRFPQHLHACLMLRRHLSNMRKMQQNIVLEQILREARVDFASKRVALTTGDGTGFRGARWRFCASAGCCRVSMPHGKACVPPSFNRVL